MDDPSAAEAHAQGLLQKHAGAGCRACFRSRQLPNIDRQTLKESMRPGIRGQGCPGNFWENGPVSGRSVDNPANAEMGSWAPMEVVEKAVCGGTAGPAPRILSKSPFLKNSLGIIDAS